MKLVVGLGNPGEKYEGTRHNVGFLVADKLVGEKSWSKSKGAPLTYVHIKIGNEEVEVIKPSTFMNESGQAVKGPLNKHKELTTQDVYVIHDDLDIKLGEYKIQLGKGPKVHYGIESVEKCLVTDQFWRVRVGVENRKVRGNMGIPGMKYVLQKFTKEEWEVLDEVVGKIVQELVGVIS
jgi:peptidyl-tRNA hydrolase, PTH1 family